MASEHGFFRAGERLLSWLEQCKEVVEKLHDSAHALSEYGAGRARSVDVDATYRLLLRNAERYNRLACGLVPRVPLSEAKTVEDFKIDIGRLGSLARRAAAGDATAGKRALSVVYRAREAHERSRNLLGAAELPVADELLERALAMLKTKPRASERAARSGLGERGGGE